MQIGDETMKSIREAGCAVENVPNDCDLDPAALDIMILDVLYRQACTAYEVFDADLFTQEDVGSSRVLCLYQPC